MPPDTRGLQLVGPHLPTSLRRGGVGGRWLQCRLSAEQGAPVEDVERRGRPAHRHDHTGTLK